MVTTIESYLAEFNTAVKGSVVTAAGGRELGLSAGMAAACQLIKEAAGGQKKVMVIGNGGSAAIASHLAVDLWKNAGIRATAFNDSSLLTCAANDYGYEQVFARPVEMFAEAGDVLVAISSSGRSPNILNGVKAALAQKCRVLTLSGFQPDNPLRQSGELNIYVPSADYGPVETAHGFLAHFIYDLIIREKKGQ